MSMLGNSITFLHPLLNPLIGNTYTIYLNVVKVKSATELIMMMNIANVKLNTDPI